MEIINILIILDYKNNLNNNHLITPHNNSNMPHYQRDISITQFPDKTTRGSMKQICFDDNNAMKSAAFINSIVLLYDNTMEKDD